MTRRSCLAMLAAVLTAALRQPEPSAPVFLLFSKYGVAHPITGDEFRAILHGEEAVIPYESALRFTRAIKA